jgi:hypothetical protein
MYQVKKVKKKKKKVKMYQVKNTYFPNIVNSFRLLYGRKCKQVKEYLTDNDAAA